MFANHDLRTTIRDVVSTEYLSAPTLLKILLTLPTTDKEKLEQYNALDNFIERCFTDDPSTRLFQDPISPEGFNAFEIAILLDDKILLEKLHNAGSMPNAEGIDGLRPIHLAAKQGLNVSLTYLIEVRTDINSRHSNTGYTPLMFAAWFDQPDSIALLSKYKVELNLLNDQGLTAASLATKARKQNALLALIKANADLDAPACGTVPLMVAVDCKYPDMLQLLCNANANVNARLGCQITGITALFKAVKIEFLKGVEIILNTNKAELDYRYSIKGITAIFQAAMLANVKIFKMLFERYADIYIPINTNQERIPAGSHAQPFSSLRRYVHFKNQAKPRAGWKAILAIITGMRPPVYRLAYPKDYKFCFKRHAILENSICTYGSNHEKVLYTFSKELGRSTFNLVYTMAPDNAAALAGFQPIAVKEFIPVQLKFVAQNTLQEVEDIFTDSHPDIIHETRMNYLVHGVGAFFCDLRPITGHFEGNILHITDYPRCYMAMKHFEGVPLTEFKITDAKQYFQIFIELMLKIKSLHQEFVHGDLAARNVIIDYRADHTCDVNIIDFNTTRKHGELIDTTLMQKCCKPPEFSATRFIKVNTSQDIFCLGLMMYEALRAHFYLMAPHVIDQLQALLNRMLIKRNPSRRIDLDTSIAKMEEIQALQLLNDFQQIEHCKNEFVARQSTSSDEAQNQLISKLKTLEWQQVIKTSFDFFKILSAIKPECQNNFFNTLDLAYLQQLPLGEDEIFNQADNFLNFIVKLDETYNCNNVDHTIKAFLAKMVDRFGYARALAFCDNFEASQPQYFKRMLLICNQIYQDNRNADPRRYYSIFGWYSKETKIDASKKMETAMNRHIADFSIFKQGAVNQGDLGKIARRLRRCC
jgi:ankyrin repeat protein/serine/threonine protein kinase